MRFTGRTPNNQLKLDGGFAAEDMRAACRSSSVLVGYSARLMRYCRPLAKGVGIYHYQLGSAEGRR